MSSSKVDRRLDDIVSNIDRLNGHIEGLTFEGFLLDLKAIDAVERCLERIVEAASKIGPDKMAKIFPNTPLHKLRALGNALRHEYDEVDLYAIWITAIDALPPLRAACVAALG